MKRMMFIAAAFAALVCCSKSETSQNPSTEPGTEETPAVVEYAFTEGETVTITAGASLTKVSSALNDENGVDFKWESGDTIKVTVGEKSSVFKVSKLKDGGVNAEFTGKMPDSGDDFDVQYPVIDPVLTSQTYSSTEAIPHDAMKFTATSCTVDKPFTLTAVNAALRLNLYGTDQTVGKIVVTNTTSTADPKPSYTLNINPAVTIGSTRTDSTSFFIVVEPGSWNFSAEIFDNSATPASICSFETTGAKTFIANNILNMSAKEVKIFVSTIKLSDELVEFDKVIYDSDNIPSPYQLTATIFPDNASDKRVVWSSSDEGVATVDQDGLVTFRSWGLNYEVSITCTAQDGSNVYAECNFGIACLAAGTRITMADGTYKDVEEIEEGDLLRTFDHEAGIISSARVFLAWKGETKAAPLVLSFASGKSLSIVGTHDLLLETTRKYVRIHLGNVADYVGRRFYNAETGSWDTLVSYAMGEKPVAYYCIYTAGHINCVAEGMLTCPDDVDYILNIYELDTDLKADADQLAADIDRYGLMDVERDYPECIQHKQILEDYRSKYLYIAIGKGLISQSTVDAIMAWWSEQE